MVFHVRLLNRAGQRIAHFARLTIVALGAVALMFLALDRMPTDGRNVKADRQFSIAPIRDAAILPQLCAHRIVGDERKRLGTDLPRALTALFSKGITCFDADIVRCAPLRLETQWRGHLQSVTTQI